jgi:hypothetical protein
MQGAGERLPPNPTGAALTRTAEPRKSARLVPVRRISVIDRLLANSLEDGVFGLVKPRDATSSDGVETA